ncbi:hypothetical protein [Streptomyces sp. NPDC050548]|uniref:hypothetical protein n=1 Tax=Streptomyces sp. NPDC050548 TaxID=3365629 RepID=UPI0037A5763E
MPGADLVDQASITKAAVAIGSWDPEGSHFHAAPTPAMPASLRHEDIAAEVCSMPLSEDGTPLGGDLSGPTVSMGADRLRQTRARHDSSSIRRRKSPGPRRAPS